MGKFRIEGVTGPDEYSAVKDNNVYTNLMAQYNLSSAADLAEKLQDAARELGVTTEEAAAWRDAAADMHIPFDSRLEVHPQHDGFTQYARWDFADTPEENYPLLLHYPYFQLYRKQVVKQADLVLAMQMRGDAFTPEQKRRNFDYYEALTVRDSSLSACTQAVMAAEVGHLDLAYDYLAEAAFMDLQDREHNTKDGLHIASLAGAWTALVGGFGGMRCGSGQLMFSPRLPPGHRGAVVPPPVPRPDRARRGPFPRRHLLAAVRRPHADHPPRPAGIPWHGPGHRRHSADRAAAQPVAAGRAGPAIPPQPPVTSIRNVPGRLWGRSLLSGRPGRTISMNCPKLASAPRQIAADPPGIRTDAYDISAGLYPQPGGS